MSRWITICTMSRSIMLPKSSRFPSLSARSAQMARHVGSGAGRTVAAAYLIEVGIQNRRPVARGIDPCLENQPFVRSIESEYFSNSAVPVVGLSHVKLEGFAVGPGMGEVTVAGHVFYLEVARQLELHVLPERLEVMHTPVAVDQLDDLSIVEIRGCSGACDKKETEKRCGNAEKTSQESYPMPVSRL